VALPVRFTKQTLTVLRALKRHNDREWFRAHLEIYEKHVRQPMVALIQRMSLDLPRFAPDLVASPRVSLYRVYRDTRFSEDKSPLKTHIGALFPCRGLPRHEGAALYLEIAPGHVLLAGGIYMPQPRQVQLVREHLAANFGRFRSLVESPAFRRAFGRVEGNALKRVPRGFPPDHPAAEYLKLKQFLVVREYPDSFAASPRFYSRVLAVFREMAPFLRFLNEPLLAQARAADPLLEGRDAALPDATAGRTRRSAAPGLRRTLR
jgi:uncharacterized protein (TIGR02453 family)